MTADAQPTPLPPSTSRHAPDMARLAGANVEHAGRHNQRVVLHIIRVAGPITRAEIAEVTGLTHATVSNITNRLLDTALLSRAGQRRGGRGQPATRLVINPDGAFSIGINIDRDHLTLVTVDFSGKVRARRGREMRFPMPEDVATFYREEIGPLLREAGIAEAAVRGVGVALPDDLGSIDLPGRPAGYERWSSIDIAGLFAGARDLPVFVENDAAAAAIGEMQFGLGQRYSSFFYLLVAVGLGGGVVVNSLYDRGANGRSGEIGFLRVDDGKGGQVPLQTILSLAGLAQALAAAGLDPLGTGPDDPRRAAVIERWIEDAAAALVRPLVAVNCLLNPGAVLIGGRMPIDLVERLVTRTTALLAAERSACPAIAPIEVAALAEDSPAVGAALLPFAHLMLPADNLALQATAHTPPPIF